MIEGIVWIYPQQRKKSQDLQLTGPEMQCWGQGVAESQGKGSLFPVTSEQETESRVAGKLLLLIGSWAEVTNFLQALF